MSGSAAWIAVTARAGLCSPIPFCDPLWRRVLYIYIYIYDAWHESAMNFSARSLFFSHLRTRVRMFGSAEHPRVFIWKFISLGFQGRKSPIVLEEFAPRLFCELASKGFCMWACGEADSFQRARISHLYCWLSQISFLEDGLRHKIGQYY